MNLRISPQEAAKELLTRRSIRRSLTEYARFKGFEPAAHHRLIIREIEAFLADPSLDVLMLHAPPGSAKSTYLSVLLPPHYLAQFPSNSILAATHSQEFAQRWGRKIRNDIILDGLTLGIQVSQDNSAADRWALKQGGEYYGVGAGVGISGFRADLGMCDDLFGSREDAYSETVREKRWDWYRDDFCGRLKPGAKRILMNTRWHEEDVAGWSALYQQRPAPEEGDYFKAEWLSLMKRRRRKIRCGSMADLITLSPLTEAITRSTPWWGSIRKAGCTCWTFGASRPASDVWVEAFCDLVRAQADRLGRRNRADQIGCWAVP
jgi:hypothetical protein